MDVEISSEPGIVRRLDRSLEQRSAVESMCQEDRKLLNSLRSSVEGCKNKVESLKDELDKSEHEREKNKVLREAAEERLRSHLFSMYSSPAVDAELRQRLPRSNKSSSSLLHNRSINRDTDTSRDINDEFSINFNISESPIREHNLGTQSTHVDFQSLLKQSSHMSSSEIPASDSIENDSVRKYTQNVSNYLGQGTSFLSESIISPDMKLISLETQDESYSLQTPMTHSTPLEKKRRVLCSDCLTDINKAPDRTTERQALLHSEVALLKEKIKSLEEDNKKLTLKIMQGTTEGDQTTLLDKINEMYLVQKKQEEAIMARMKQAYHERDEILQQLCQLRMAPSKMNLKMTDMVGDEDDGCEFSEDDMDKSPQSIEQRGLRWAKDIREYQAKLHQLTQDQINSLREERDELAKKCVSLERRLLQLQRADNSMSSELQLSLENKLDLVRKERDYSLMKVYKLESDLQALKSNRMNESDKEKNGEITALKELLMQKDSLIGRIQEDNSSLKSQVSALETERQTLSDEVKSLRNSFHELNDRKKQLESLVTVLRRKLKTNMNPSP